MIARMPMRVAFLAWLGTAAFARDAGLIASPDRLDFGRIEEGDDPERTCGIRNPGSTPVRIDRVETACTCTVALLDAGVVPPGGEIRLKVAFHSRGRSGSQRLPIRLFADGGARPALELPVLASIRPAFVTDPPVVDFGEVEQGCAVGREVSIRDAMGRPFRVRSVATGHPHLRAEVMSDGGAVEPPAVSEVEPHVVKLRIVLDPSAPPGPVHAVAEIQTDRPGIATSRVLVQGVVQGRVRIRPLSVFLGQAGSLEGMSAGVVTLSSGEPGGLQVLRADVEGVSARAAVIPVTPDREYRVEFRLTELPPPGRFEGKLLVYTSVSPHPYTVTISGVVQSTGN